jgi:hypothetical protein
MTAAEPLDYIRGCCKLRTYQDDRGPFRGFGGICYMDHKWRVGEDAG